jgi:hypothetical protein
MRYSCWPVVVQLPRPSPTKKVVRCLQASVLVRFKERPAWVLDELALVMKLSPLVLRKSVIFWASQGQRWGV